MKVNSKYSENVLLTDVCQEQKVGKFAADRRNNNNNNNNKKNLYIEGG